MVVHESREDRRVRSRNDVQDVELSRVPGSAPVDGADADGIRVLDTRSYLLHYAHLQDAAEKGHSPANCGKCGEGVEAFLGSVSEGLPGRSADAGVVQGGGSDEEGPTAPPSASGRDDRSYDGFWDDEEVEEPVV